MAEVNMYTKETKSEKRVWKVEARSGSVGCLRSWESDLKGEN